MTTVRILYLDVNQQEQQTTVEVEPNNKIVYVNLASRVEIVDGKVMVYKTGE